MNVFGRNRSSPDVEQVLQYRNKFIIIKRNNNLYYKDDKMYCIIFTKLSIIFFLLYNCKNCITPMYKHHYSVNDKGVKRMYKKCMMLFGLFVLTACTKDATTNVEPVAKDNTEVENEVEIVEPKEPENYHATISAIGDILIHNSLYEDAQIGNGQYDFSEMFAQVKPYLERADITVANSESIIGGQEIGLSSYPAFNSPYEVGDILKEVGVDLVNMANNHTLDRGEKAILNATNYWDQLGITYVGAAKNEKEAKKIKTLTANGIVFSFLGYTYGTNGIPIPDGKDYLVNYIDEEKMIQDIQAAKEISDVVVLNLHIGDEYHRLPNEYQEHIAQLAADNGATIIFAHHSHVLQPVKWYTGVNGNQTFVIHSLGNFLSGQNEIYRQIGALVEVEVFKTIEYDRNGDASTLIEVKNPKLLPTYVEFENWRDYQVIPMFQVTNDILPDAQYFYNDIKSHMSQYVSDLEFIESDL